MVKRRFTLVSILAIALIHSGFGVAIMAAQDSDSDIDRQIQDLKKQKELLDARKALLDSQKAYADAQKATEASQQGRQDQVAAAKAAKDLADAQKSFYDAKKASSESQTAALKAQIGDVTASGLTGAVEAKEKTGQIESVLLAAKAVRAASATIRNRIVSAAGKKSILVFSASDLPNFQSLIAFRAQQKIAGKALDDAIENSKGIQPQPPRVESFPIVAAAGIGLQALSNILSYFRSDYTVNGVDFTLDDLILVNEVANELKSQGYVVAAPALFNRAAVTGGGNDIATEISSLAEKREDANARAKLHESAAAGLAKQAEAEKDPAKKPKLQKESENQKNTASELRTAIGIFDAWFSRLSATDDKAAFPIVAVIRESTIEKQLDTSDLLLLKVQKAGGSYLTKKNLWTFFGSVPLYHMGGAVVSFTLIRGADGTILAAGAVPVYGGFVKAGDLPSSLAE